MIKKELRALRTLRATPKMMEMAKNDQKIKREYTSWYGYTGKKVMYEYCLFMRCQTLGRYLKVAFFLPEHMRCGSNMPAYELFIDKEAEQYLTWDCRNQKWSEASVINLIFHSVYWVDGKIWINPEGNQTIKRYLGVEKTGFKGIEEYQAKIRAENIERKYKRITDPWDAELNTTPALPKDWKHWCSKVAVRENLIFYDRADKGPSKGQCTYCENTVLIDKPVHNKKIKCPHCGREVTLKSKKKMKYFHTETYYAYLMQRTVAGFVVREFSTRRAYRGEENWKPHVYVSEHRRAFYNKEAKPINTYQFELFRGREHRYCRVDNLQCRWGSPHSGSVYGRTLPSLSKVELSRTGMQEMIKAKTTIDPEWYLALWNQFPQMELLVKAGFERLIEDCQRNRSFLNEVCILDRPGGLAKKMQLDDQRLRRLRTNNGGMCFYRWLRHEKKHNKVIPDEVIRYFAECAIEPSTVSFIADRMSEIQVYNYLRKQSNLSSMTAGETVTTWKDYLSMALKFGMDVNDAIIYKASKLKQRHDELVLRGKIRDMEAEAKKVAEKYPHVEQTLTQIKDIYSYEGKDYCLIVPDRIVDIMVEGRNLNHCVATSDRYMDRIERRESYVIFLRKTEAPMQSYYTLEIEPDGTVRQKRTMYDRQHPDVEKANKFLKQWQKEVAKRLTDQDRALAKKSKELRIEGFNQMRRDHVTINTGFLRGKLLVDVLMADLMENEEAKTA